MNPITGPKTQREKNTSSKKRQLVLFDFDGTLTTHDTLGEFMKFYHGKPKYYAGLAVLSPIMMLYLTRVMKNWKAKQYFLSWFLRGEKLNRFNARCLEFNEVRLPQLIRKGVIEAIQRYKAEGATIAVVSASAENWVQPFCSKYGLFCLATRLETQNNLITGNILGKNCHGEEKVCRILQTFDLSKFDDVIAYGDTSGDKEMLELAHQKFYKPFRD